MTVQSKPPGMKRVTVTTQLYAKMDFQSIDPRINSGPWDFDCLYCTSGYVFVPKKLAEELTKKLKQHPSILVVNGTLTTAGKLWQEKEKAEALHRTKITEVRQNYTEVFIKPRLGNIPFKEIDSRIIDLGTTWHPTYLTFSYPNRRKSLYQGPDLPSIFVPK